MLETYTISTQYMLCQPCKDMLTGSSIAFGQGWIRIFSSSVRVDRSVQAVSYGLEDEGKRGSGR
jgi:hypothetical protein